MGLVLVGIALVLVGIGIGNRLTQIRDSLDALESTLASSRGRVRDRSVPEGLGAVGRDFGAGGKDCCREFRVWVERTRVGKP